jgi:AraC family transcriptional regulator, regulatory protein of adaptative response / methylated-DNA-[protein]-cysteine methyltransferase
MVEGLAMQYTQFRNKVGFDGQIDPRWSLILARDRQADGQFYYSVKTTGVYCKPSCPSRLAKPENVAFHATMTDAELAGFRACKRCKPDQASFEEINADKIAVACRTIEIADVPPLLGKLAAQAGLSPHHFHRVFKSITGLTPKGYASAHRTNKVRSQLRSADTVTKVIYDVGFNSSSRFYEKAPAMLGMTPSAFNRGGVSVTIHFAVGECRLGSVLVATSEKGVCAILLGDDPDCLLREFQDQFPHATLLGGSTDFEITIAAVVAFIDTPQAGLNLPLDVQGTAFQQRVWQALRQIPLGKTASYGEIARLIGSPKSCRAVAQACATNALAVVIPCHRVVRTDGSLSGYRWGIERKRQLLEIEAV